MDLFTALLTACAFLILFFKIGILRILRYELLVDIATSALLAFLFWGTLGGMLTALIAGLIVSITLSTLRKFFKPGLPRIK